MTLALQKYPEFYSFPPFFTVQPVLATREKQMALWRELILRYHTEHKIKMLVVHDCPLWKNPDIGRELSRDGIDAVMNDFVKRCVLVPHKYRNIRFVDMYILKIRFNEIDTVFLH